MNAEQLRDLFDYNPLTGRLIWRRFIGGCSKAGKPAGGLNSKGYYRVRFDGKDYLASRVIYCWMTGEDPGDLSIDHIDRNPLNNCIWNLRKATVGQQIHNRTLNCTGVRYQYGKYMMRIMIRGKRYCKSYPTYEQAATAYQEARAAHPDALLESAP